MNWCRRVWWPDLGTEDGRSVRRWHRKAEEIASKTTFDSAIYAWRSRTSPFHPGLILLGPRGRYTGGRRSASALSLKFVHKFGLLWHETEVVGIFLKWWFTLCLECVSVTVVLWCYMVRLGWPQWIPFCARQYNNPDMALPSNDSVHASQASIRWFVESGLFSCVLSLE